MKIIYVKRVAKGEGGGEGGGSNHTSRGISLLNHASRIIFLTNDVKRSQYTTLILKDFNLSDVFRKKGCGYSSW